jgi:hypothetical protein
LESPPEFEEPPQALTPALTRIAITMATTTRKGPPIALNDCGVMVSLLNGCVSGGIEAVRSLAIS